MQMHFFLLMNKQGKVRLAKWFSTYQQKERTRITKEVASLVLPRDSQVWFISISFCTLSALVHVLSIAPLHSAVRLLTRTVCFETIAIILPRVMV